MLSFETAVRQFRLRLAGVLTLRYALWLLAVWGFLWGTVIVALRGGAGFERLPLLWGLAGVPACLALAAWLAFRRLPADAALRAYLDGVNRCGGLLMATAERTLGAWAQEMPPVRVPRLRWQGGRTLAFFAVAALFVAGSFLAPQRLVALGQPTPLEVRHEVAKLAQQIDTLERMGLLEPERARELTRKLEEIERNASGTNPGKTLEALDHLRGMLDRIANERGQGALQQMQMLGRAQLLAEALLRLGNSIPPQVRDQVVGELAAMAQNALASSPELRQQLGPDLAKHLAGRSLAPEQLQGLADAFLKNQGNVQGMMQKLQQAGLVDGDLAKQFGQLRPADVEALSRHLQQNLGKKPAADVLRDALGPLNRNAPPTQDEGAAPAPLTWGKPTEEGKLARLEPLPPADVKALKQTSSIGVGTTARRVPKELPRRSSTGGTLTETTADGGSGNAPAILPRQLGTVERYFERKP
jgi:hypothetical protein